MSEIMNRIPVDQFAKDHWSTFAYVESCCVDSRDKMGLLDARRMRCNSERHPLLSAGICWDDKYSTRLKGFDSSVETDKSFANGTLVKGHDDWDCLDDLENAGLIEIISLTQRAVIMTKKGFKASASLRQFKAEGGNFRDFQLDVIAA